MTYRERQAAEEAGRQARTQAERLDMELAERLSGLTAFDCFRLGFEAGQDDRNSGYSYIEKAPVGIRFEAEWLNGYYQGREGL